MCVRACACVCVWVGGACACACGWVAVHIGAIHAHIMDLWGTFPSGEVSHKDTRFILVRVSLWVFARKISNHPTRRPSDKC